MEPKMMELWGDKTTCCPPIIYQFSSQTVGLENVRFIDPWIIEVCTILSFTIPCALCCHFDLITYYPYLVLFILLIFSFSSRYYVILLTLLIIMSRYSSIFFSNLWFQEIMTSFWLTIISLLWMNNLLDIQIYFLSLFQLSIALVLSYWSWFQYMNQYLWVIHRFDWITHYPKILHQ